MLPKTDAKQSFGSMELLVIKSHPGSEDLA